VSQNALAALDLWHEIGEQHCSSLGWAHLCGFNASCASATESMHVRRHGQFAEMIVGHLIQADIYHVRSDVVDLVSAAAEHVPYHPVLDGDELPASVGFVQLAKPLGFTDVHGKVVRVHAFQWWPACIDIIDPESGAGRTAPIVAYGLYGNSYDQADDYVREAEQPHPLRWPLAATGMYPADQKAFPLIPADTAGRGEQLALPADAWADAELQRWLLSWWIVVDTVAPKPARRRVQRAMGTKDVTIPTVKIVDLRRRATTTSTRTTGGVDWTHRWGVRPHWRRAWRPSVGTHRLRLIGFHIKGPDDKPLVLKTPVFDVQAPEAG
jgi:hypothetical protein